MYDFQSYRTIRKQEAQERQYSQERGRVLAEFRAAFETGCTCHECGAVERPEPQVVPELLTTRGGFAVVTSDRVTGSGAFSDVWGDAR